MRRVECKDWHKYPFTSALSRENIHQFEVTLRLVGLFSITIEKEQIKAPFVWRKVVWGTRDNPPPRDNFTERLYDKKLAQLTEIKLTQLIIPKSYFDVHDLTTPFA